MKKLTNKLASGLFLGGLLGISGCATPSRYEVNTELRDFPQYEKWGVYPVSENREDFSYVLEENNSYKRDSVERDSKQEDFAPKREQSKERKSPSISEGVRNPFSAYETQMILIHIIGALLK
jgi:hypothetical protein